MRFVHLAPRASVAAIRRNGLRLGDGQRGRGVYAVPFFEIRRETSKAPDEDTGGVDVSVPLSSTTIWRFLFDRDYGRSRPVAVVFSVPPRCWPIDVFLEVAPLGAERFLAGLEDALDEGLAVTPDTLAFVRDAARLGYSPELSAVIGSDVALGKLLHLWMASGVTVRSRYHELIEVVIRKPVPASAIERLLSLSVTNRKANLATMPFAASASERVVVADPRRIGAHPRDVMSRAT
jgi:hypothetical protein